MSIDNSLHNVHTVLVITSETCGPTSVCVIEMPLDKYMFWWNIYSQITFLGCLFIRLSSMEFQPVRINLSINKQILSMW